MTHSKFDLSFYAALFLPIFFAPLVAFAQGSGHVWDGDWIDERGSKLELTISGSVISGKYVPQVISADCLNGENLASGILDGDQIVLGIQFENCDVLLTLIGQFTDDSGDQRLYVSWVSNRDIEDVYEEQALWASFEFGSVTFSQQ